MNTSKGRKKPSPFSKLPGRPSINNRKWPPETNGRQNGHEDTKVNGKRNNYMDNTPSRWNRLPTQKWRTSGYPARG